VVIEEYNWRNSAN